VPKRILIGQVVSHKNDKTAMVKVKRMVRHPLYKKIITKSKRYAAHDEGNAYNEGAWVMIQESRPYSKTKSWEVIGLKESVSNGLETSS
jgi:small subunit ribosomal protein S17